VQSGMDGLTFVITAVAILASIYGTAFPGSRQFLSIGFMPSILHRVS